MESMSLEQREAVLDVLQNIKNSIIQLREWNKDILEVNDLLITTEGIKTLTADCMLLQAIGEGIKKIDKYSEGQLLPLQPQIPWKLVMGMRDHIAHGYFDINTDLVWSVLKEDLDPLESAIDWFLNFLTKS